MLFTTFLRTLRVITSYSPRLYPKTYPDNANNIKITLIEATLVITSYSPRLYPKTYPDNVNNIKITLIEATLVTLMPSLNIFLPFAITLKATIQNNLSKSRRFSREIPVADFHTIVFGIHSNFTYDSETYQSMRYLFWHLLRDKHINGIFRNLRVSTF